MTFEQQLEQLEQLVRKMESGAQTLEETLGSYQSGMEMAKKLEKKLSQAEKTMLEYTGDGLKPMEDAP